ncbi:MAG: hypothetical protein JNK18_12225 [Cyclobacteriaceae bacterium]|nr:hypothetical protein [Cyclobacteriaceae bacterium]
MKAFEFNALLPPVWIVAIATLAIIVFVWLEIARKQRLLPLRLVAVFIAIGALACLALNPHHSVEKSSDIILLTAHYNNETLDSLVSANSAAQVYKLADVAGAPNATPINYRELNGLRGNIHVLGQGLPEYMLDYLEGTTLHFYPANPSAGITGLDLTRVYTANRVNTLDGTYYATGNRILKLQTGGITLDSVLLKKGVQRFRVSFAPKAAGQYVYTLTENDSLGNVLTREPLPVDVKPQQPLSILLLHNFPTAEIRFLKNYLETQQHKLTLRYTISKDRYRTEFVNTKQETINRLTEPMLKNYDLVITDASSLASLSGQERNAIERAIASGLGILTVIDSPAPATAVLKFLQRTVSNIKSDSASITINHTRLKVPATSVSVASDERQTSLLEDTNGRAVSGYVQHGFGKNGFSLLSNTFTFQLSGQAETYATLWSDMISALARKEQKPYDLAWLTSFPVYPDEPIEFQITSASEKPSVLIDSVEVPVSEHSLVHHVWYGKFWAGRAGWNSLTIRQSTDTYNFFVSQPGEWNSLRVAHQQKAMQKMISAQRDEQKEVVRQAIPRALFFVLFVLAAGFLWLAPKL